MNGTVESWMNRADPSSCAGYFEGPDPRRRGALRSLVFRDPDDRIVVGPRSDLSEIAQQVRRFFRSAPQGAVVGYFGFDAFGLFEPLVSRSALGSPFPLAELACIRHPRWGRVPRAGRPGKVRRSPALVPSARSLSRRAYCQSVGRLRQAIRAGEAYQVVLAHRREWKRPDDLWSRALELRRSERYSFFYALRFDDRAVVSASPESVLEVRRRTATVSPIAGTRPLRGERRKRLRLLADRKELAEHRMLVDLARNDLGRVSVPGGVRVLSQERPARYAELEHLVSRVAGTLRSDVSPLDAFGATFPAGTVSGAPKIRATELLRREESTWRGPYGGAVGVLEASGDASWALNIRSAFARGSRMFTAAGAGIVYGSEAAREYDETLAKLAHVEQIMVGADA